MLLYIMKKYYSEKVFFMFQILVAEDNQNSAKLMKIILNQAGYKVVTASNGIEALEIMDTKHIDLIVLDVMMPKMNGFETLRTIRNRQKNGCKRRWILLCRGGRKNSWKNTGFPR